MNFTGCHVHESRQVTIGIKAEMEFDGTFGLPERGPGEDGKTKIDGSSVKQIQLAFEFEPVLRGGVLTSFEQREEQFCVEFMRLVLLDSL